MLALGGLLLADVRSVIPAKAGIQFRAAAARMIPLDSCLRRNDE